MQHNYTAVLKMPLWSFWHLFVMCLMAVQKPEDAELVISDSFHGLPTEEEAGRMWQMSLNLKKNMTCVHFNLLTKSRQNGNSWTHSCWTGNKAFEVVSFSNSQLTINNSAELFHLIPRKRTGSEINTKPLCNKYSLPFLPLFLSELLKKA